MAMKWDSTFVDKEEVYSNVSISSVEFQGHTGKTNTNLTPISVFSDDSAQLN